MIKKAKTGPLTADEFVDVLRALPLGPFEIDNPDAATVAEGARMHLVEIIDGGLESFSVRETVITADGQGARAYRTEQRIELATRLQLPQDYDPLDLVGRVFLVEA